MWVYLGFLSVEKVGPCRTVTLIALARKLIRDGRDGRAGDFRSESL